MLAVILSASAARAENATPPENCPPGSVGKASGAFAWCEPTVCIIDTDCGSGMVCRTLGLCMNAGTVDDTNKDAATRLAVTNLCGANKSCPNDTICSERLRCVDKAVAQRMNLLAPGQAPAPSASAAAPNPMMPKKSACGCTMPGGDPTTLPALAALALGVLAAARRRAQKRGGSGAR